MSHIIDAQGPVIKKVIRKDKTWGKRRRYAMVNDGYISFLIPWDRDYVIGQNVRFVGQIVDIERGKNLIRLMGSPVPLKE